MSTWNVQPAGAGSSVTIESSWEGAGGIGGFFERTFAPMGFVALHAHFCALQYISTYSLTRLTPNEPAVEASKEKLLGVV